MNKIGERKKCFKFSISHIVHFICVYFFAYNLMERILQKERERDSFMSKKQKSSEFNVKKINDNQIKMFACVFFSHSNKMRVSEALNKVHTNIFMRRMQQRRRMNKIEIKNGKTLSSNFIYEYVRVAMTQKFARTKLRSFT